VQFIIIINDSTALLLGLGLIRGRTHWTEDQPVARPLLTRRTTHTDSATRVQFEPGAPIFKRPMRVHALDHAATVIDLEQIWY
jgi:hypothetical protein